MEKDVYNELLALYCEGSPDIKTTLMDNTLDESWVPEDERAELNYLLELSKFTDQVIGELKEIGIELTIDLEQVMNDYTNIKLVGLLKKVFEEGAFENMYNKLHQYQQDELCDHLSLGMVGDNYGIWGEQLINLLIKYNALSETLWLIQINMDQVDMGQALAQYLMTIIENTEDEEDEIR